MFVTDRFDPGAYDCLVVGSGPAGVSLALALARARKRVLVFESGDADQPRSELSNSIGYGHYAGEYWNGHWFRALGGTSAAWAGDASRTVTSTSTIRPSVRDGRSPGLGWCRIGRPQRTSSTAIRSAWRLKAVRPRLDLPARAPRGRRRASGRNTGENSKRAAVSMSRWGAPLSLTDESPAASGG